MTKESSAEMASTASRMLQMDVIEDNRIALRQAIIEADKNGSLITDIPDSIAATIHTSDGIIDAFVSVIQPYLDDAKSLAGSVMSQAGQ